MKSFVVLFLLLLFFTFAKDVRSPMMNESSLFSFSEADLEQQQFSRIFYDQYSRNGIFSNSAIGALLFWFQGMSSSLDTYFKALKLFDFDTVVILLSPDNSPNDACSVSYQVLNDPYYSLLVDEDLLSYLSSSRKLHLKKRQKEANQGLVEMIHQAFVKSHLEFRYFILSIEGCTCSTVYALSKTLLNYPKRLFPLAITNLTQTLSESNSYQEFSDSLLTPFTRGDFQQFCSSATLLHPVFNWRGAGLVLAFSTFFDAKYMRKIDKAVYVGMDAPFGVYYSDPIEYQLSSVSLHRSLKSIFESPEVRSFTWSDSLKSLAVSALSHHSEMKGGFCIMFHWFNSSGEVVHRNGCVNRISDERSSVDYFLRYLKEAMNTMTLQQFRQVTEVVVSIVFHILLFLFNFIEFSLIFH